MWNAKLDESQAEIKIDCRNINNLRYADYMTVMVEIEEELKSLLRVKEESEKYGLKLKIQKTKFMISSPITLWQIGEKCKQWHFIFLVSKITVNGDCSHDTKRLFLLGKKSNDKSKQLIKKTETLLCLQNLV